VVVTAAAMCAFVSARNVIVCTVKIRRNLKYFQRKFKVKPSFVSAVAISFFLYPFPYRLAVNLFLLREPTHAYPAVLCVSCGGGHAINSRLTELNHRSQIAPMSINDSTCAYMSYSSFVIIEFDFSSVNVCEDATT
jgi:hypothetical protein